MIVISGTIVLDPANLDAATAACAELEAATRAESGCVQYGYWLSHSEPGTIRVFEEWADEDSINAHMASPDLAKFMEAAGTFGITAIDLQRYDVAEKTKFM